MDKDIDYNLDSLSDLVAFTHQLNGRSGTKTCIRVFEAIDSNSFKLAFTWENVTPLYFKYYDIGYIVGLPDAEKRLYYYNGIIPLRSISFIDDTVVMHTQITSSEGFLVKYMFEPENDDFFLQQFHWWKEDFTTGNVEEHPLDTLIGKSISRFSYEMLFDLSWDMP